MSKGKTDKTNLAVRFCCLLIIFYQKYISCNLPNCCRYNPSCSQYTLEAIKKYGVLRGSIKGFLRILRCNPFAKGGDDFLE